tara:strand:- start:458 stop:853 length:396 start_codon:yes stop_codon:yes gene_type:complete
MSQIFKKRIEDSKIVVEFLKTYCQNEKKNEYIFSPISYKKAEYNKDIKSFIDFLKKYYHKSKQFYLNRTPTYKNFLTILRQACNHLCISYTSKIIYNKSKYNIIYIIYLNNETNNETYNETYNETNNKDSD